HPLSNLLSVPLISDWARALIAARWRHAPPALVLRFKVRGRWGDALLPGIIIAAARAHRLLIIGRSQHILIDWLFLMLIAVRDGQRRSGLMRSSANRAGRAPCRPTRRLRLILDGTTLFRSL